MGVSRAWIGCVAFVVLLAIPLLACARSEPAGRSGAGRGEPLRIVATTGMVADLVREIAGERAEVRQLMGAGVDPHMYKPTRGDVAQLTAADAVFYNGLLLEGKMTETFERLRAGGKPVVAITSAISARSLLKEQAEGETSGDGDAGEAETDPHVWMDPALWATAVGPVRDALVALDPASKAAFESRASAYAAKLKELDGYAERVLNGVPERSRVLVTAHDAFGYFGRRYGYQVEGIQGISTESEAGVKDIQRLVDLLVERKITSVFVESSVSDRNVSALIAGARAKGHSVSIGGTLFSDAMGQQGTYEGTYVGMIDHNVTTIARSLGGEAAAPAGGMQGKLQGGKK